MILTETIELNGKQFKRTYSDTYQIRKVGTNEIYSEAVDILTAEYEYEETNLLLNNDQITDSEALEIITGGVTE